MSTVASWLTFLGSMLVVCFAIMLVGSMIVAVARWLTPDAAAPTVMPSHHDWRHCAACKTTILHGGTHECGGAG